MKQLLHFCQKTIQQMQCCLTFDSILIYMSINLDTPFRQKKEERIAMSVNGLFVTSTHAEE
jgi:hypothetical protein